MKYLFFFLSINLLFLPNITFGSLLSDPTGLDLYKKIDSGYYDLEVKYLQRELRWWDVGWSIVDDLNKRARLNNLEECFSGDVTVEQMKKVYNDIDSAQIISELLKNCFDEETQSIPTEILNNYFWIIRESYYQNSLKAQTKVDSIYKIGRIGMYSDGIDENSPFDLILDLEDINSIIFEEHIPYDGVNSYDIGKVVDGTLWWIPIDESFWLSKYNTWNKNGSTNENDKDIKNFDEKICIDDNNQSGLNENIYKNLILKNTEKNTGIQKDQPTPPLSWENEKESIPIGSYKRINDNDVWPCDSFFCILIDFVTYNHNLLWWWTNLSIEWLFKRSNTHLKRFASTSLIQSKMTTNNFEIWLKDLNLPDLFHVWIQVSYKPVPMLNVDKKDLNAVDDEWRYENLFTTYYRNLGLDFKRRNDLKIFSQKEAELKSLLDSQELTPSIASEKFESFKTSLQELKKQNHYISSNIVDKKVIQEDINGYYQKYIELESFTRALMEYTFWAKWIIYEINKIPQWW